MRGIYNYIPETNHVSRVHSVAAVLYLQICATCYVISPVKSVLCFYISISPCMCAAPNMTFFFLVPLCRAFLVCCSGMV